jgi:hypothetical protein
MASALIGAAGPDHPQLLIVDPDESTLRLLEVGGQDLRIDNRRRGPQVLALSAILGGEWCEPLG